MADTEALTPIVSGPKGRDMDHQLVLQQLGFWTRARIAWQPVVYDRDWIKGMVSCGGRRKHFLTIKLAADDTFSIEFGRMVKRIDYVVVKQAEGIYNDVLGEVVERMYQEVYA